MKHSIRQHWLALSVAIVAAAAVAACGQVTTSEEAQPAGGIRAVQPSTSRLVQSQVCVDGAPGCGPTGAHGKHGAYACTACHKYGGVLSFDAAGPAYGTGQTPTFDATSKTCSNVACHGVPAGTYSYWFPGGDGEPAYNTVTYGGTTQATPSWYATGGAGCIGCHGNPPVNYSWHGSHGGGNQCELCHSDATSNGTTATGLFEGWCSTLAANYGFVIGQPGTTQPANSVRCSTLHANGSLNVTARFGSSCFGCH